MAMKKLSTRSKTMGKAIGGRSVAPIPMEWLGPPAWRLPSGKALAEFALQTGFLAPLLLGDGPFWHRKLPIAERASGDRRAELREGRNGLQ
jgi:hypothetical protein